MSCVAQRRSSGFGYTQISAAGLPLGPSANANSETDFSRCDETPSTQLGPIATLRTA